MLIPLSSRYKNFSIYFIVALSVVTVSLMTYLFIEHNNARYQENIAKAKEDTVRLTRVIGENIELSFLTLDQTIRRSVERQHFNALFGGNLQDDIRHNLKLWANETPHVDALLFTDQDGLIVTLYKKNQSGLDFREGEEFVDMVHFEGHKTSQHNHLLISPLILPGEEEHSQIIVSRRQEHIDGSFGGLVVAIMDGSYLTNFFRSIEAGQHTQMALILDNRELLINNTGIEPSLNTLNVGLEGAELISDGNIAVSMSDKYINNQFTLFSFGRLRHLPITVALVVDEQGIFTSWRANRDRFLIFVAIVIAFILTVVMSLAFVVMQIKRVKKSEEKAIVASQSKSEFLAKMSHELRTPLNAIIGFSEMLSSGCFGIVNKYQQERLRDINMCGNHLLEFVNDILDFSKGEAGKSKLKESNVEVAALVKKAIRVVNQKAELGGVRLINTTISDDTVIYADGRKIRQILINLLSNAVKFTPRGGRVRVTTKMADDGFSLVVSDTGIGIAPEDIPRAFEVFEQVHDKGYDGTGLGLPLCKMFAELHGGKLSVKSKLGIGTRMRVTLPKKRVVSEAVADSRKVAAA